MPQGARIEMAGQRFGRWTVLAPGGRTNDDLYWQCRCECGTEKRVNGESLRRGDSNSCGCTRKNHLIHGHSPRRKSKEYAAWSNAKGRCYNPRDINYRAYGARGIRMCSEWLTDFAAFYAHIGACPPGWTLDRIDNDRGYEPGNVRWLPRFDQGSNKSTNLRLEVAGESMTVAQAARRFGLKYGTLISRIRRGWLPDRAVGASPTRT